MSFEGGWMECDSCGGVAQVLACKICDGCGEEYGVHMNCDIPCDCDYDGED